MPDARRPRSARSLRPEAPEPVDLNVPEQVTKDVLTDSRSMINAALTELGAATYERDTLRVDRRADPEDVAAAASRVRTAESALSGLIQRDIAIQVRYVQTHRETPGSAPAQGS